MTVPSTTTAVREAIDEARDLLAPAAERLVEAAGQMRDNLRDTVAPQVVEVAARVRDQGAPKIADKVAEALSSAADRVGAHGTTGTKSGGFRWKSAAIGVGAVAGIFVVARVVRARRTAGAVTHGTSQFPSIHTDEQKITDLTEAKLKETLDHSREAVTLAVASAAGQPKDPGDRGSGIFDTHSDSGD